MKLIPQKLDGWGYCTPCTVKIAWSQVQPFPTDPPVWRTDRDGRAGDSMCALQHAVARKNIFWKCVEYKLSIMQGVCSCAISKCTGVATTRRTRTTCIVHFHQALWRKFSPLGLARHYSPPAVNSWFKHFAETRAWYHKSGLMFLINC